MLFDYAQLFVHQFDNVLYTLPLLKWLLVAQDHACAIAHTLYTCQQMPWG